MNSKKFKILDYISISIISVTILIISIGIVALTLTRDQNFYKKVQSTYDIKAQLEYDYIDPDTHKRVTTTYTDEEIDIITKAIIDYLSDETESMQCNINGKDVFSTQAINHMEDVLVLYHTGEWLVNISIILFVISFVYLIIRLTKGYITNEIFKVSTFVFIIILILGITLLILIFIDFEFVFGWFHMLAFPTYDSFKDAYFGYTSSYSDPVYMDNTLLVRILNENLFLSAGIFIIIGVIVSYGLWFLFGLIIKKKYKNKENL